MGLNKKKITLGKYHYLGNYIKRIKFIIFSVVPYLPKDSTEEKKFIKKLDNTKIVKHRKWKFRKNIKDFVNSISYIGVDKSSEEDCNEKLLNN